MQPNLQAPLIWLGILLLVAAISLASWRNLRKTQKHVEELKRAATRPPVDKDRFSSKQ